MVFPVFAAIYYWAPVVSGKQLSERMGKWACSLMFIGVHATFFPMHFAGMAGMPRRVWTYSDALGWDVWNLVSTAGAFMIAIGVLVVLVDLLLHLRPAAKVDVNPWNAGTLEWLPLDNYAVRSIPRVTDLYPLWADPALREQVDQGRYYLPGTVTGTRETIVTSARDARPEFLLRLPGPSWLPALAGLATAVFFFALTVKWSWVAAAGAALTIGCILRWLWDTDPAPSGRLYDVGGGVRLPDYMNGWRAQGWWAVSVLLLVNGAVFLSLVFSYLYLGLQADGWLRQEPAAADVWSEVWIASGWLAAAAIAWLASRALRADRTLPFCTSMLVGIALLIATFFMQCDAARDLDPRADAQGATVWALLAWQGVHVLLVAIMAAYTLARRAAGKLNAARRVTFENTWLMWVYTAAQGLAALLIT
jgi:cytochrome c oxidase subunit I+III